MSPAPPAARGASFAMLWVAETTKLFSRTSARVGLLASAGIGFFFPFVLLWLVNSGMQVNGVESQHYFDGTPTRPLYWALVLRNLLLVRVFLVVLGAQSVAGELSAHTLREDLLRPVTRMNVLLAKWAAILTWDAASLLLTFVVTAVPSLLLLGASGPWGAMLAATALNVVCDAGFVAVVLAVAVLTRSSVATVGGVLVLMMMDTALGWGMYALAGLSRAASAPPWATTLLDQWPVLPGYAFNVWTFVLPDVEPTWVSVLSLVGITLLGLGVAGARLQKLDVP